MSGKDIHADTLETLRENAPSSGVVKSWIAEFKRGRRDIADEPIIILIAFSTRELCFRR